MPKAMRDRNFCGIGMRKFLEIDYCGNHLISFSA